MKYVQFQTGDGSRARTGSLAIAALVAASTLAACGGSSSGQATAKASPSAAAKQSCDNPSNPHRAAVVAQPSTGTTITRCVGFTGLTISAVSALQDSGIEVQTQNYGKLGPAPCQVANVPAHYTQCLPAGKPYWALFVSLGGAAWTSPPVGLSGITLHPGDTLGLRYDSPEGTPAPPLVSPPRP